MTASSAEPRPALPEQAIKQLKQLGLASQDPGGATVAMVVGDDREQLPPPPELTDLTPMRRDRVERIPDRRKEQVDMAVEALGAQVSAARSDAKGLDLLALLDQVGERDVPRVLVISSGVSTVDPLDFRELGWARDIPSVVQDLAKRGLLPRHLRGKQVTFAGLGATAGSQPRLPTPQQAWVEQLWLAICQEAGAQECRLSGDVPPAAPPLSEQPVPVVPVPKVDTLGVVEVPAGPCRTVLRLPSRVLFAGNSAELLPGADPVLVGVVRDVAAGATVAEVAGHTADAGDGDGRELSEQRARAVADRLRDLGVSPERVLRVVGHGETRPVQPNLNPDGSFNEELAAQNRRVELLVASAACPNRS